MNQQTDSLYKRLFKASQGKVLVSKPNSFEIIAVTDEFLKATNTIETDIVGKELFEVFSASPEDSSADFVQNLSASLMRVQSLKATDIMSPQRYSVRLADGAFEERFWSPVNIPVLDDSGEIEFIMHRVQDVTSIIQQSDAANRVNSIEVALEEITQQSNELKLALTKLQEHEARMGTAQRMLSLGAWEYNPETGNLHWSKEVFDIYGVPQTKMAPNAEEYFALVHPDDRESSYAIYQTFNENRASQILFEHRVIAQDGEVRYIKGVGERHLVADGETVVGYVQDVTPFIRTRDKLTQAEHLLRLAGEKVQLGGWRVVLDPGVIIWTPGTAAIHDMPPDYSPSGISEAIEFYAPEFRELILAVFELCAQKGKAFDIICQLQTPGGRRPWVRSMGEAERDQHGNIIAVQGAFQDISSLRRAQAQVAEAEFQRINILESISDAFFALDEEWNFTYLNHQACILLDRSSSQLLGRKVWVEFPEAVGTQFQREYEMAFENKQTAHFQAFFPPLQKWFDVSAYPIPDGLAVYFRDVTREREQQQQMRLIDAALSRQNDIVMITDADALDEPSGPRIVYVNDAFERLTGYTKGEAIGRTPRILQGPATERGPLDRLRSALTNKEPIRCEVLNYKKSGEPYWLELDITPLFDDQGQCTHFVAVERDISQRKKQESELKEAQERFQLISKATNDVIWDWDLVADKVWWNDTITEVFGYKLSELEPGPDSWSKRIHADDLERVLHGIYEVIEGKEESWQSDYRFLRNDGQSAFVIDRGFVIRDANGNAIRMVGSMLDVTKRMEMERQLRESQKLEAVGHLTGGVAHDFNNLLTVIMGNAEMMTLALEDENLLSMAKMTLSAAQRGAELTSRLLAFARRKPLDPKPTNLNLLAEAMRALIRRALPENIELQFALDPDLGITEIDASELDTALLNLVVNARDAMQTGGKLTIGTANAVLDGYYADRHSEVVPGDYVMICVSDTGIGMTADTLSKAVEPFFTTKLIGKGSGLGLSMVFGFTKQSGGHLSIYSEHGEGTSVKLYFPRVEDDEKPSYQPTAEQRPEGGTEHILIAEDEELVLQYLEAQLSSLGYRVSTASSGPDALKTLKANPDVALLLTDIIMPGGMNGRELAAQAQVIYPSLKVLYTSGYTENAIVHHGRLDPGVNLLSKPYSRLELATKVRAALKGFHG